MNRQIEINYNGHKTAVTCLPNDEYYIQITNSPYVIKRMPQPDGSATWIEVEQNRETELSENIGNLIAGILL